MGNAVIYRPVYDAEVEYLESTGTQWIDTGVYGNDDTAIECRAYITDTTKRFNIVGARNGGTNTISIMFGAFGIDIAGEGIMSDFKNVTTNEGRLCVESSNITGIFVAYTSNSLRRVTDESSGNEWTLTQEVSEASPSQSIKIGYKDVGYPGSYGNAYIKLYYCKIWNGSTPIRDFIPVRIGSVGYLYDKVTKQLFANKGTGNFILGNDVSNAIIPQQRCVLYFGNQRSVIYERVYESYEWLKTDTGKPWIKVADGYNTDNNAYLETTFKCASVNTTTDIIIGVGSDNSFGCRLFVSGSVYVDIHKHTNGVLTSKRFSFATTPYKIWHVFINSNRYEFNDVSGIYELGNGFDAINRGYTGIYTNQNNNDMHYAETKMRVNNVEYDLVPCKLLQSIPAILDGNGIARQAGECGMWDKVNDKFYGNVASSGTFTVSN